MPIIVFKCEKCGFVFEEIVPFNTTEQKCPQCEEKATKDNAESLKGQRTSFVGGGWTAISGKQG